MKQEGLIVTRFINKIHKTVPEVGRKKLGCSTHWENVDFTDHDKRIKNQNRLEFTQI